MNNFLDNKMKALIGFVIGILILLVVILLFAMCGHSYTDGFIKRELLVNVIATVLSGYLGIVGVLIAIWGTYYMFVLQTNQQNYREGLYIKQELEYTLIKTSEIAISLEFIYRANFHKYRRHKDWTMNNLNSKKTSGKLVEDIDIIEEQVNFTALEVGRSEKNKEDISNKSIEDISDIYLFKKKFDQKFNDELIKQYNINNISINEMLIEKAIYRGISINYLRDWVKLLNGENRFIDVFEFLRLREGIKEIVEIL